jgi:hypothetical protein
MRWIRCALFGSGLFFMAGTLPAQESGDVHGLLQGSAYYAREDTDREWHVRLVGTIASFGGAYIVIHDAKGKSVYHSAIPRGDYTEANPFHVAVRADGITGDYKITLVGYEGDLLGIKLPLTDLPEVYGGTRFTLGPVSGPQPSFQVPEGVRRITLAAYKGQVRVLKTDKTVVADSASQGRYAGDGADKNFRFCQVVEVPVMAGETYVLAPQCHYLRCQEPLFLTFRAAQWFLPDPALDDVKWWKGIAR